MANQGLTGTLQELTEYKREEEWRRDGVPDQNITFSRLSGMDARDIGAFRNITSRGFLIVVRCPKLTARAWHGILAGKPRPSTKKRLGWTGVLVSQSRNRMYVSDYDLMSAWRRGPQGFEKIVISAEGSRKRGRWNAEALTLVRALNNVSLRASYMAARTTMIRRKTGSQARGSVRRLAHGFRTTCGRYERVLRVLLWPSSVARRRHRPICGA